jgi:hypothetical protein
VTDIAESFTWYIGYLATQILRPICYMQSDCLVPCDINNVDSSTHRSKRYGKPSTWNAIRLRNNVRGKQNLRRTWKNYFTKRKMQLEYRKRNYILPHVLVKWNSKEISSECHIRCDFYHIPCTLKSSVFWDTTPCSLLKVNQRFGGCRCHCIYIVFDLFHILGCLPVSGFTECK